MSVKVTIKKVQSSVPDEFILNILSSTVGMSEEEFQKLKRIDGSISIYVSDNSAIEKLKLISEKYSYMVRVEIEDVKDNYSGGAFSLTTGLVKANLGLAVTWSVLVVLFSLLSAIPFVGFFITLFSGAFYYGFILYCAYSLLRAEGEPNIVFRNLKVGDVFREYLGAGFGMSLGFMLISMAMLFVMLILFVVFGSLGAISDMITYGTLREGFVGSLIVGAILVILFGMWLLYVMPLIVAKAVRTKKPTFASSLIDVIRIVTPSFLKESFSGMYIPVGAMWSLIITVGLIAFFLTFVLIITIPVSLLILYWINVYLAVVSAMYIRNHEGLPSVHTMSD